MKKLLFSAALVLTLLAGQAGVAFAQDATPPASGTVVSVVIETDAQGVETVLVTYSYLDTSGAEQTESVRLSVETATDLGLVTTDAATNKTVVATEAEGSEVTIDPADILPEPEETDANADEHPVGSALDEFFSETLGVKYSTIMDYHEDGAGFGVIAQALWMTKQLDGDAATFEALMDAKKSGDYSAITLADGSTPRNWGDVVKSLKQGDNLGSVKSGRADAEDGDKTNGNAPDDKGKDKVNDNKGGKDKSDDKGKSGDKGNKGGKP